MIIILRRQKALKKMRLQAVPPSQASLTAGPMQMSPALIQTTVVTALVPVDSQRAWLILRATIIVVLITSVIDC